MFKTKKEVDAHVRTALSKIRTEAERHLRSLTIAKLYFKINEFATAEQYLNSYLSVKQDNDQAHKLLGQCYQRLKKPDKALQAFQLSLQLNSKQTDVLAEVCQLLLDDKNLNCNNAKYWVELAESEKVQHEAVFSLRLKLMNKEHLGTNHVEELLQKEISARPNDVPLRVRLVRNYVEKNQILDAFKYVHQLEMSQKDEFATSSEWYNIVWLVLNKYEKMPNTKKDWDFWLLVAMCLERQVQIAFTSTSTAVVGGGVGVGGGVTEIANLLFNLDQYLFKIAQLSDKFCAQRELVDLFLEHYRGQLLLHATAVIFKRELLQNKNKWKETTRAVLPLLLLAYQIKAPENNKEPWMKHCDEQSKQLVGLWQREGSFRCAQAGRILLSCINDDPSMDKENAHNINYLLGSQSYSSLWQSNDELLTQVRQTCSDRQWRHNIFALLFCNSDQKVKEQSSLFAKCAKLSEPAYELPAYADVEHYEDAAQYLRPQSLQHMVYLCLGNDNLAYVRAKYFSGLNFSTHNLSFCGAEFLNQLDVDSFLYAASIQAKRALEVDRETFDIYQSGNSSSDGKPRILPFVNLLNILCTEEQSQWWNAAYMVYKNLSNGNNLAEVRATLQYGIEAVRGINGPKIDMAIVFKLGQLFVARAQDIVKPVEKTFLEARAEAIYKYGLNMLKMHNKGVLEPFRKYFKYYKAQSSAAERELSSAAEDAVSYLATRYFKKSEYEDLIDELSGVQLPFATYLQAEAYRKLDEASKTPRKTKRMYLDRASECLNQTLALLKSSAHADPNHPLNSVIHSEIKRLQQNSSRYINDSNTNFSPITGHNNSSTYEDAEADVYAENSHSLLNSSRNRRETLTNANALKATHNQEIELLTKQITETLKLELSNVTKEMSAVKEKIANFDTLTQELGGMSKEIVSLKEKVSSLEDTIKKIRVSSNPPSRDDASNVLDDLYLIEDTLQQQLYQQQQQQQQQPNTGTPHNMTNQQYGNNANSPFLTQQQQQQQQQQQRLQAAAAFNAPIFPPTPNFPMNFYGHPNQPNPYIMAQQAPVPNMSQRAVAAAAAAAAAAGLPALSYMDPTVPVVPPAGLNFNMPVTSTPLLPPPPPAALAAAPPQPQAHVPAEAQNKPSNLYNLLQQITPNISNQQQISSTPHAMANFSSTPLTHTSITMSAPIAANTSANIQIPKPLNSQQLEKVPPANVVITSSDPLPNPNTIAAQAQHQTPLSVTIPSHHIKPSIVSQPPNELAAAAAANNTTLTTTSSFSNSFGSPFAATTFSFKPQIAAAAAAAAAAEATNNTSLSGGPGSLGGGGGVGIDSLNKTSESLGSDFNRSATADADEYDPRPDFKAIIPLPDEIEVRTGEENEQVMFCHRAKLFRHVDKEWKERGIGDMKILKNNDGNCRILMRRDQTHKICANHAITAELNLTVPKNETKGFIWVANDFADEALRLEKFFVRFKLPETAKQFQQAFKNAQKEAKNKTTSTAPPTDDSNRKKEEQKPKSTAAFSLAKSQVTNFATSTPSQKNEPSLDGANAPSSANATNTTTTGAATNTASKSLFSGLNLSTKTASKNESSSSNKPASTTTATTTTAAVPSPFANFSFGKSLEATTTTATHSPAATAASVLAKPTNAASPFASIFSNLSNSPFATTTTTTTTTTVQETAHISAANKSAASDTEDEYVPTAHFNPVIPLPDVIEVNTGEENELVLFEHRAKLLRFDKEAGEWKERGLGNIKLLQDKDDINKVRLVMRREHIHKLCCNQRVYKDTAFKYAKNSKTALTWAGQDFSDNELVTEMLTVRFKLPETCNEFLQTIQRAQRNMTSDGEEANSKENEKDAEESIKHEAGKGFGAAFKPKAGSWSCEACYITNDAQQLYCVACNAPKDNTVPKQETTTNVLATSSANKFNFGFNTATVAAAPPSTTQPTSGFGDTFKPKSGAWTCQSCYLSNAGEMVYCNACGAPKDDDTVFNEMKTTAPTAGFGNAFKPKAGSWTCQACYVSNGGETFYCTACDAPKDDSVPKKEANANILALSNPTQKFSFGFGSSTGASASDDSSKSHVSGGFSFNSAADSAKSFAFTPPFATSTALTTTNSSKVNTIEPPTAAAPAAVAATAIDTNTAIGKSSFTFSLSSKAMESSALLPGAGGESTSNAFPLDKKEFSFTLTPKSPGKTGKSPMLFGVGGGGGGDADEAGDAAGADDGDADLHEEEENNTYFTPVIPLPDKIDVKTGEENEDLLYVHRAKLYRFTDGEWKERGLGDVKILRHKSDKKLRVLMRREHNYKICLNHVLSEDVDYKRKDDKSWLFVVNDFSEGAVALEKFSLRFKSKELAEEFMEAIKKAVEAIEVNGENNNTSLKMSGQTPSPASAPTNDLALSGAVKKTADKLKLPYEFFATKPACAGCRGCHTDTFEFADNKNIESFVNKEDIDNQLLTMELPAFTLKKSSANRSLLKQSTLSPANLKTEAAKLNDSTFSGFGGANSMAFTASPGATTAATDKPANTTFSFTAALNNSSTAAAAAATAGDAVKSFSSAGSGGFLFGSGSDISTGTGGATTVKTSIFGGAAANENKATFGQKPVLFGAAFAADSSNNATVKTNESSVGSIFGEKPVFGSSVSAFGSASFAANDSGGGKPLFGNLANNTTQSAGGKSIFGSSSNSSGGFGAFGANNSQASVFGSSFQALPQFGSLAKEAANASAATPAAGNATFADILKSEHGTVDFASLAAKDSTTATDKTPVEYDLSKTSTASIDFADLAKAAASPNTSAALAKAIDNPSGRGGFVGLTHNNDFSSFEKPQKNANSSISKANDSGTGAGAGAGEDGVEGHDENYDPHYEPIIELPDEIVVVTGEEEETKLFGERATLYRWDDTNKEWKERGVGELKILLHPVKQSYRLLMRREQIHKCVLNHGINGSFVFTNMKNNPKSFVWVCLNYAELPEGELEKLAVRFKKIELSNAFHTKLTECIAICKQREAT